MSNASFHTSPIDDVARDGSFRIVMAEGHFNLVRWCDGEQSFVFGSGMPIQGEPVSYVTRIGDRQ
jgi:hypothetical protein